MILDKEYHANINMKNEACESLLHKINKTMEHTRFTCVCYGYSPTQTRIPTLGMSVVVGGSMLSYIQSYIMRIGERNCQAF